MTNKNPGDLAGLLASNYFPNFMLCNNPAKNGSQIGGSQRARASFLQSYIA